MEKSDYGRNIVVKELGCSVESAARASRNKQFKFTMHAPAVFATLRTALGISEEDFLSVTPNAQTLLLILRKTILSFIKYYYPAILLRVTLFDFPLYIAVPFSTRSRTAALSSLHCQLEKLS